MWWGTCRLTILGMFEQPKVNLYFALPNGGFFVFHRPSEGGAGLTTAAGAKPANQHDL